MAGQTEERVNDPDCDVLVVGGGPAGSCAAITLARRGHRVGVLEKAEFPRFHIGESMLPYMVKVAERVGVREAIEGSGFVRKRGAEFTFGEHFYRIDFSAQGEDREAVTFQVERARFDQLLLDQAEQSGARVLRGARAVRPLLESGQVVGVTYEQGGAVYRVKARFLIDASGRAGLLGHHFKLRRQNERLKMVAVFKHLDNVDEANNPGVEGDIQIGAHSEGWVWAIPIRPDAMSVGAVTRPALLKDAAAEDVFDRQVARNPRIVRRIAGTAELWGLRTESDFCYFSDRLSGPNFLIAGDAGCFTDPVFSGGVYLAMTTGFKAGETADALLRRRLSQAEARSWYERFYKTGYDCYFRLIYAFYDAEFNFGRYLATVPRGEITQRWVARMIGGDFWSQENPFSRHLRQDAGLGTFAPFELTYGCPAYEAEAVGAGAAGA